MALEAGVMVVNLEFAQGLKDKDLFGKQDPYCILTCGSQTFRSNTAKDGGKNPVWNETFRFNVINENDISFTIKDEDVSKDEVIGTCRIQLAKAREQGTDRIQAPVQSKSGKQHGFIAVHLTFERNSALKPQQQQQQQQMMMAPMPGMMPMQQPMMMPGYAPAPYGYAPAPGAPAPYGYAAPAPYGAAPPHPGYAYTAPAPGYAHAAPAPAYAPVPVPYH